MEMIVWAVLYSLAGAVLVEIVTAVINLYQTTPEE